MLTDTQALQYASQYYAGKDFRIGHISDKSVFKTLRGARVVLFHNGDRTDYVTINDIKRLI